MKEITKILMQRDACNEARAKEAILKAQEEITEALANGGSYYDIEDILYCKLGLEMDYIEGLI